MTVIPSNVNIMALTATATTETFHVVCKRLSMNEPVVIALPPDRGNIFLSVKPKLDLSGITEVLFSELMSEGAKFPKTLSLFECTKIVLTCI